MLCYLILLSYRQLYYLDNKTGNGTYRLYRPLLVLLSRFCQHTRSNCDTWVKSTPTLWVFRRDEDQEHRSQDRGDLRLTTLYKEQVLCKLKYVTLETRVVDPEITGLLFAGGGSVKQLPIGMFVGTYMYL